MWDGSVALLPSIYIGVNILCSIYTPSGFCTHSPLHFSPLHRYIMEDLWEYHKDVMRQQFLTEDKTLREVMEFMNDTHNFHARYSPVRRLSKWPRITDFAGSKAQYERWFKKWKFHKNRKSRDWKSASRIIEKRKRDGKESDLYIDGVLISKKRICKETSRHNFQTIQERYGEGSSCSSFLVYGLEYLLIFLAAPSPKTPDGFYVCTPPAFLVDNYLLRSLPWFKFQGIIQSGGMHFTSFNYPMAH